MGSPEITPVASTSLAPPNSNRTRHSTRSSPRRQDSSFVHTPDDSRTSLSWPARPIIIGIGGSSEDDEEGDEEGDDDDDGNDDAGTDAAESPTPQNELTNKKNKQKQPSKKRKNSSKTQEGSKIKKARVPAIKDFTAPDNVNTDQVTDNEGPKTKFRTMTTDDVKFLLSYFKDKLVYVKKEEHIGIKRGYVCKWCNGTFTRGTDGNSNLYGHRDGYQKRKPCPHRGRAIKAGVDLPPTWKELNEPIAEVVNPANNMKNFLSQSTFGIELLNVVLVIWILRHALPWLRFQDPTLRAAFKLTNRTAELRSPKWAATTAKELFYSLYNVVISRIQNNSSMFSLAHDGWTTKGNRMAFIGVMINYIDDDWNYQTVHLTLKLVTWHHCGDLLARPVARNLIRHGLHKKMIGQTTDSGASNGPMAREMARLFAECDDPVHWSPKKSHVKCFCHKLALMVTHGLKTISIGSGHIKPTTQPGLAVPIPTIRVNNEDLVDEDSEDSDEDQGTLVPDITDDAGISEDPSDEIIQSTDIIARSVHKVNKLIQMTCSSSSRHNYFASKAKAQGLRVLTVGYGVRWNVKADSRRRACEGKEILNAMTSQDRKTNKYYRGLSICDEEWEAVEALNPVLEVFEEATYRMQGDFSSGCEVLAEYLRIKKKLETLRANTTYPSITGAINEMLSWLKKYQDEALETDIIIIATILNPRRRLKFLEDFYPDASYEAKLIITDAFEERVAEWKMKVSDDPPPVQPPTVPTAVDEFDMFAASDNVPACSQYEHELADYLSGKFGIMTDEKPLEWWRKHETSFPVLASMARDYLSISATTCCCERSFSSAADVAAPGQGSILPNTITRKVGCREWIKCGIVPTDKFEEGVKYLKEYEEQQKKKKSKNKNK